MFGFFVILESCFQDWTMVFSFGELSTLAEYVLIFSCLASLVFLLSVYRSVCMIVCVCLCVCTLMHFVSGAVCLQRKVNIFDTYTVI